MTGGPEQCQCVLRVCWRKWEKYLKFVPKNTSVRDGYEVNWQLIPDTQSGNGEGLLTKFESGWLLDKVVVAGRVV